MQSFLPPGIASGVVPGLERTSFMKGRTIFCLWLLALMLMGCASPPAPYGRGGRGQGFRPYKGPASGSSLPSGGDHRPDCPGVY